MIDAQQIKNIIEACLLVAGKAMSLRQLDELFEGDEGRPDRETIKTCIEQLQADYEGRGIELVQVASGYRLQSRTEVSQWVARLFPEKPPRYSRALLETLVLVAYRQPITRGEIEEIRGVAVSSNIVKTLQERQWVKEVGVKDVPGKPALLGTTKHFLDYFNLKRLDDLPPLSEIKNLDEMDAALMEAAGIAPAQGAEAANDGEMTNGEVSDAQTNLHANTQGTAGVDEVDADEVHTDEVAVAGSELSADSTLLEGDLEQTSFVAGSANGVDQLSESDSTTLAESSPAGSEVIGTDTRDAPVTFAGLVSDLPPLEQDPTDEKSGATAENISDEQNGEEQKLYSKISEYAEEHQKDVDARDELESRLTTRSTELEESDLGKTPSNSNDGGASTESTDAELVTADADEQEHSSTTDSLGDAIEASSSSIDVLSDTFTGDSPGAGETLH